MLRLMLLLAAITGATTATLFFASNSTTAQSFSVGIIDDTLVENLVEGTEQFRIDITAVNPVEAIAASAFNLGDTATLSITD